MNRDQSSSSGKNHQLPCPGRGRECITRLNELQTHLKQIGFDLYLYLDLVKQLFMRPCLWRESRKVCPLCIFLFPRIREQEQEAGMAELKARISVKHLSYQAEFSRPNDIGEIITGFQRLIVKEEQFLACGHSFVMKKISISFQKIWGRKSIPCLIQRCLSQCSPNSP